MHHNSNRFYDPAWHREPESLDLITRAGFRILECEGLKHLSLKRIQTVLGCEFLLSPEAHSMQKLQVAMLGKALASLETIDLNGGSGRDRLKAFLLSYIELLRKHPGLAELAQATVASGAKSLRLFKQLLQLLGQTGIKGTKAARAADLILLCVTAVAASNDRTENFANWALDVIINGNTTSSTYSSAVQSSEGQCYSPVEANDARTNRLAKCSGEKVAEAVPLATTVQR